MSKIILLGDGDKIPYRALRNFVDLMRDTGCRETHIYTDYTHGEAAAAIEAEIPADPFECRAAMGVFFPTEDGTQGEDGEEVVE